jgi:hypothetical protein
MDSKSMNRPTWDGRKERWKERRTERQKGIPLCLPWNELVFSTAE